MHFISEDIIKTAEFDKKFKETLYNKCGYSKGDYISKCSICNKSIQNVSKRCHVCFECACKLYIFDMDELLNQCIQENEFLRNDTTPFTKKALFIKKFRYALKNGMTKLIVAVKMNQKNLPEQSIELIINDKNLHFKLDYYDKAYDDNLVLKNCSDISIVSYMFA